MSKASQRWKKRRASPRPTTYTPEEVSTVIQTALSKPQEVGEDDAMWTLDRLVEHLQRVKGIPLKRSRISEIFIALRLRWRHDETWRGLAGGARLRQKKGAVETVYTSPPAHRMSVCLDQMGPVGVKSSPGKRLALPAAAESTPAGRAKQEIEYGRREKAGYVFGALHPKTGEVLTATSPHRRLVHWIDLLQHVEEWIPKDVERVSAVLDNLSMHRASDVLRFNLAYPRWEVVFQPTYAAYWNLIEPWWKTLKSLALKGKRSDELARDRGGGAEGDGVLECPQASVCVGASPPPSDAQAAWHCPVAKSGLNLPDAPLST